MRTIAIKRKDGGVSILKTIGDVDVETEVLKWDRDNKDGVEYQRDSFVSYREINEDAIPKDRTFRDAWTDDNPSATVDVDMSKARNIHMNRIRVVRDERLNELDKRKYGDEFDVERQALRDMPQSFSLASANTPEELESLWPNELEVN